MNRELALRVLGGLPPTKLLEMLHVFNVPLPEQRGVIEDPIPNWRDVKVKPWGDPHKKADLFSRHQRAQQEGQQQGQAPANVRRELPAYLDVGSREDSDGGLNDWSSTDSSGGLG